jgi:hypothetical protein
MSEQAKGIGRIEIRAGDITAQAELNETQTAQAIWEALPFEGRANRWGEEIYFSIPVTLEMERGQEVVEAGDLGYWAPGRAFCIFFGPTPASRGEEIRPASPVTVFGHLIGEATVFQEVKEGTPVLVRRSPS